MTEKTINITKLIKDPKDELSPDERYGMKRQLAEKLQQLDALSGAEPLPRARLQLDIAELLNALERRNEAWDIAREGFVTAMQQEAWQDAVEACDVLFQAQQDDSMTVLGMGIWLGITFPIEPEVSVAMLIHLAEETPDASDAGALAAITARYVADLRASDEEHENLCFLVDNLISMVAKRHSNVQDQAAMDQWLHRLDLRDPQVFLPCLAQVVDAIVGGKWWFDRDVLRGRLPE